MKKVKKWSFVVILVIFVVGVVSGFLLKDKLPEQLLSKLPGYNADPEITSKYISEKFSNESTLVSQKLTLEGYSEYTDKGVPVLTKGDFTITYKAEVTAGIDVKKIKVMSINHSERVIRLKVPKAEIFSVKVDPDSIEYHDEKIALFNMDQKEDSDRAEALAEEDAKKEAENCGILQNSDTHAETLIKGILQDYAKNYSIEFV